MTNTGDGGGNQGNGPFYGGGSEINIIVPFSSGGASDTFTRMLGEHFRTHIEGEPSIVVEAIPGGGQKDGLNAFERTEHNGMNMVMGSGGIITATQFDDEGIQFDLPSYEPVMAFGGGLVIYAGTSSGITSLEDLANSSNPVYYGNLELNAAESVRVFALEQMGLNNFEPLMGYDGGGAVTAAVMRGELTLGVGTASHYLQNVRPLEEQGDVVPLMVQGYVQNGEVVRDPAFPDVPTMPEAYQMLTGQQPEGPGWDAYTALTAAQTNLLRTYWVHGDAPAPAREALNAAAERLVQDEAFLGEAAQLLGAETRPLTGDELDQSLSGIYDLPPETVQWVEDYMAGWQ